MSVVLFGFKLESLPIEFNVSMYSWRCTKSDNVDCEPIFEWRPRIVTILGTRFLSQFIAIAIERMGWEIALRLWDKYPGSGQVAGCLLVRRRARSDPLMNHFWRIEIERSAFRMRQGGLDGLRPGARGCAGLRENREWVQIARDGITIFRKCCSGISVTMKEACG